MNDQQFAEVKQLLTGFSARLEKVEAKLPAATPAASDQEPGDGGNPTNQEQQFSAADVMKTLKTIQDTQAQFATTLEDLKKEVPGTTVPPTTGAEGDLQPLF